MRVLSKKVHLALVVVSALLSISSAMPLAFAEPPEETFQSVVKPFISRHCVDCHFDAEFGEAGLDLNRFDEIAAVESDLPAWKVIYDQIDTFAMPPRGSAQPSKAEREAVP